MINFKWGLIFAVFAFIFSVMLGLVNLVNPVHILRNAIIFSVVFFGLGLGLYFLIHSFFPELLYISEEPAKTEEPEQKSSLIDITLGTSGEYAVPELYRNTDDGPEMGNIEDLISGAFKPRGTSDSFQSTPGAGSRGVDRKSEDIYNSTGKNQTAARDSGSGGFMTSGIEEFQYQELPPTVAVRPEKVEFTPSLGDNTGDLGGLPDLDMLGMAFSPGSSGGEPVFAQFQPQPIEEFEQVQYNKSSKPETPPEQKYGDFNAKDLAEGIRTVLAKDK